MGPLSIRTLGAGAVVLALAITVRAQNPPPVFRGGVDVVHVDVSVLDKSRKPVRGLTAKDFTVLEDGKPREIVAFAEVDLPPTPVTPAGTAQWLRDVAPDVTANAIAGEGRLVVIMFDWSIRFPDQAIARRIATAAVDGMGPGDLGAVVFNNPFSNAGTKQNFTADKARLLEVINRPMTPAPVDADGELLDMVPETTKVVDSPACLCGVCVFEKVEDVADAMANIPGRRKTLLFIGNYFPPPLYDAGKLVPQNPPIAPPPPPRSCTAEIRQARESTARKLGLANVTVHVIEPAGVEALQMNIGTGGGIGGGNLNTAFDRQVDLPFLANLTGGRTVMNDNTPEVVVPAIMEESGSYYVLAFPAASRSRAKDGINQIDVKVGRKDLTVQARNGYQVEQTAAALKAAARSSPLARAIDATLPRTDVALTLSALPIATPGKETAGVAVILRTPADPARTARATAPPSDHVNVVVAAVDPEGRIVGSMTQSADIPWAPNSSGPADYELLSRVDLKPGRYEIRVASDVTDGPRGSVYGFVEVPDFSKDDLALSGVALHVSPAKMSGPKGALDDLLPIVPTARREFLTTDAVTAFVHVYRNSKTPPPNVTARIVDSTGRVVFDDNQVAPPADYQIDLPTDRLQAGDYLLEIKAASGEHTATRGVRFSVR